MRLHKLFGARLREVRLQHKLTQVELAQRIKRSPGFISNMERGINAPSFAVLELLAQSLQIEVHELFIFTDSTNRQIHRVRSQRT
jgi:transcriptional regulator with XRE-family HTH domain